MICLLALVPSGDGHVITAENTVATVVCTTWFVYYMTLEQCLFRSNVHLRLIHVPIKKNVHDTSVLAAAIGLKIPENNFDY